MGNKPPPRITFSQSTHARHYEWRMVILTGQFDPPCGLAARAQVNINTKWLPSMIGDAMTEGKRHVAESLRAMWTKAQADKAEAARKTREESDELTF